MNPIKRKKFENGQTSVIIPRCYDSHVHWKSTGEILCQVNLSHVKSKKDLEQVQHQIDKELSSQNKNYFRDDWLIGFGWNENNFESDFCPHKKFLDQIFNKYPVAFSRADGHALWINSLGLEILKQKNKLNDAELIHLNIKGGRVERDEFGVATGVLIDKARNLVEDHISNPTKQNIESYLKVGAQEFYKNGFTHIRDLDGSEEVWSVAQELNKSGDIPLFVEMNFTFETMNDFSRLLNFVKEVRAEHQSEKSVPIIRTTTANLISDPQNKRKKEFNFNVNMLRPIGLKCYFDGALGSEGALLSHPYPSGKQGLMMYDISELEEIMVRTWSHNIPLSIHTLGDEAVDRVVQLAVTLKEKNIEGLLHLEHCEVVRPDTIKKMKALEVTCHLQPSHFLTDKVWLKEKLGDRFINAFPWRKLEENGILFYFGSDSPIEPPELKRTILGIEAAEAEGIQRPSQNIWSYHSHPDGNWGTDCRTEFFSDGKIKVMRTIG